MVWKDDRYKLRDKLTKIRESHKKLAELDREFNDHVTANEEEFAAFEKYTEWHNMAEDVYKAADEIAELYKKNQ